MLDTNIASDVIRGPRLDERIRLYSNSRLVISSITEAELLFGIARKPEAKRLHRAVNSFLKTIEICEFNSAAAGSYAKLRAGYESKGLGIDSLDGLIAGHALSLRMTLVTRDEALRKLKPWLSMESW